MKCKSLFIVIAALLALTFFTADVFAQERMSRDEWQAQMNEFTERRDQLQQELQSLNAEIDELRNQVSEKQAALEACRDEMLAILGVEEGAIRSFLDGITALENKVSELERLSDDNLLARRREVDEVKRAVDGLKRDRISTHPDAYDRVQALDRRVRNLLDRLERMVKTYTVGTWSRDRDCLWNISRKRDIYDNAWLWPRIWQANRDKIRDPDIIHPGQVLQIPAKAEGRLNAEEQRAADRYYREKREGLR